ncbi:MAG TPA: hypothetical protein VKA55_10195 [Gammaproteobacteria bacterium]|nr:hypothetical protein [Gammaproteobacteria bacterium]
MAIRSWQKGVLKASRWAARFAQEGFRIPIPQSVLDRLVRRVDDPSVRDLQLQAREGDRVVLSGLKKKGLWVSFSATFALAAPGEDEPPQSLALSLEQAEPFFARSAVLAALAGIDGVTVADERVLVDLGDLIAQNEWASKIPESVRGRVRITQAHSEEGRIQLRVGLA